MYLSKLEIFGFKSFAQKVNLKFDAGVTAIVGPNGCGKTNVVDALRWVLGEQRPTLLRSDKMEDVIFNGTRNRKPLNIAEVSLTIQNTKGILPSEYAEVTITRKVFRSGEGEYYLNKSLVRLKDIKDLFMDTGMGSDAYSVIELKMVEQILSDRTEERRRLFEEAAGVTKYKLRRKETLRRLEQVEVDLTRVQDIVREVQKAVNSLERQAQKAEKFNLYSAQLRDLEFKLLVHEFGGVISKIDPLRQQLSSISEQKTQVDLGLRQEELILDAIKKEIAQHEENNSSLLRSYEEVRQSIHDFERKIAASEQRSFLLKSNVERYEKEKIQFSHLAEEHRAKKVGLIGQFEGIGVSILKAQAAYDEKKIGLEEIESQVVGKQQEVKNAQSDVITHLSRLTDLRNQEGLLKAQIENSKGRLAYLVEEEESYERDIKRVDEESIELSEQDKNLHREHAEAQVVVNRLESLRQGLEVDSKQLMDHDFTLRSEIERRQSRVDFLRSLLEGHEDISEGSQALLSDHEWKGQILTTVGEALDTDPDHRRAIENALGESIGYLVVRTMDEAYKAIRHLKSTQKGKTSIVFLEGLPSLEMRKPLEKISKIIGYGFDLISSDPVYRNLFRILLDDVVVVEDLDTARALSLKNPAYRFVTLAGDMITGKGVMKGGSAMYDEGGHIGKRKQIEELERELEKLGSQRQKIQEEYERKSKELVTTSVKTAVHQSKAIEQRITATEIRLAQIEFEKKRASESLARNLQEQKKCEGEIFTHSASLDALGPQLKELDILRGEAEQLVGAVQSELQTVEALRNQCAEQVNKAYVLLLSLHAEQKSLQKSIDHADEMIENAFKGITQREQDIISANEEIAYIETELKEIEVSVAQERVRFVQISGEKKKLDTKLAERRHQIQLIEGRLREERQKHERSVQTLHDLEMKLQELTMRGDSLKARAKDEFNTELQTELFSVTQEQIDIDGAKNEVLQLKERIKGLGAINHAAFEEYKSEKERLDFVIAQSKDLRESQKTLMDTIDEINSTAQRLFQETFDKIRNNFILIFKELFHEGDECDLRLEAEMDPLEAKIEIIAKPRGKRPTSIDLLSGGEKTLTATALLFAIYLVKPSPFCVLDEVDAPLDDANIDRFTRMIYKFSENTQFIIVTHNKRTMEAAHSMYGVTMEEEGVSKLVSVQFNDPDSKKLVDAATGTR